MESDLDAARAVLDSGPLHYFKEWPGVGFEKGRPGVYSIWRESQLIYIGMSWQDGTFVDGAPGLFGRLKSHASGRRSGDQFNVYICDRYVVPELTKEQRNELRAGARILDGLTHDFICSHLAYRVWIAPDGKTARAVELILRSEGLAVGGRPQLNPGSAALPNT